jgi:hypothetical protein
MRQGEILSSDPLIDKIYKEQSLCLAVVMGATSHMNINLLGTVCQAIKAA